MNPSWQLQDAKNHFSEVVEEALTHGPQTVTRHGREVVVVLSIEDYRRMQKPQNSLLEFFQTAEKLICYFRVSHLTIFRKETARLQRSLRPFGVSAFVAHVDIEPTREWMREIELGLLSMDAMAAIVMPAFVNAEAPDGPAQVPAWRAVSSFEGEGHGRRSRRFSMSAGMKM